MSPTPDQSSALSSQSMLRSQADDDPPIGFMVLFYECPNVVNVVNRFDNKIKSTALTGSSEVR